MSPGLKPLLLPRLVEQRKLDRQLDALDDCPVSSLVFAASSPDPASPLTPTFPSRSPCLASPLDTSYFHDAPSPTASAPPCKRQLPDVPEDPHERDDALVGVDTDTDSDLDDLDSLDDPTVLPERADFFDCFCDHSCLHRRDSAQNDVFFSARREPVEFDMGFLSEGDFHASPRFPKKRRGTSNSVSPLSCFTARWGSRFNSTLSRRRASKRGEHGLSHSPPPSEPSVAADPDQRCPPSRGPSSRSSSVSAAGRALHDRVEPPLPPTPALSFYDSVESIALPPPLDIEKANAAAALIARDRAAATTPLLPPLVTEPNKTRAAMSPAATVADSPARLTQPLSATASVSSFRMSPLLAAGPMDLPAIDILQPLDSWSDRLGHANYTISPRPYAPEHATLDALKTLCADWDLARVNYTKHLVRTGEHYGTTSKTYSLTEAKWAETDREWQTSYDTLADHLVDVLATLAPGGLSPVAPGAPADACATLRLRLPQDGAAASVIPHILDPEGKFPELGDQDIVGPMMRDAVMVRDGPDDKKHGARFWKSLVDKVGRRR